MPERQAPSRIVYSVAPRRKRPLPKKTLLVFWAVAFPGMLGAGFWYFLHMPYFRIQQIEVLGASFISPVEVEAEVRRALAGAYAGVIPRDSLFFISSRRIQASLLRKFPQISEIPLERKFPDRLRLALKERRLWGVYCERAAEDQPPHSCFYVDTAATAYEELSRFEGSLLPVIFSPQPARAGARPVSPVLLAFFEDAKQGMARLNGNLRSLALSTSTPDDARLELAEGWSAWVTLARPVEEWLGVLETVLEKDVGRRRNQLEYVDLRFGNKVFYKYR